MEKQAYSQQLLRFQDTALMERLIKELPETFWMVEVSFPELFSATRAKVGDVILQCRAVDENFSADIVPLLLWLPGLIYFEGDSHITLLDNDHYSPLFG